MPAHDALCLLEDGVGLDRRLIATDARDHLVMEMDEQQVKLGDDPVLVVAGVTEQRPALLVARQVDAGLPGTGVVSPPEASPRGRDAQFQS